MIRLNLLPQEKKDALGEIRRFAYAKVVAGIVLGAFILGYGVLVAIQTVHRSRLQSINEEIARMEQVLPTSGADTLAQNIKTLNRRVKQLADIQAGTFSMTLFLDALNRTVPEGIDLREVRVRTLTGQLSLSGVAANRNDLLAFQNALRALPYIEDLNIPLSTLTQREDIQFDFTMTLLTETAIASQRGAL